MSVVTMAVSMWITNTAATAMMMPVISAVLTSLQDEGVLEIFDKQIDPDESPKPKRIPTAFFLTAAFSSTIGGVGTLIGTGTNMTFKGILETAFPKAPQSSFVTWSVYTFPATIGSTLLTILWLQLLFMGLWRPSSEEYKIATNKKSEEVTRKVIEQKYKALGPIVWHEIVVGVMFLLAMLLWLFRQPHFIPGWADLISVKTSDSIPALIPIILMFIIPAQLEFLKHLSDEDQPIREKLCLNWELITKKTPWGLLFLLGGGFALSTGGKESGMSLYLSNKLLALESLPHFVIVGIMCLAAKFGSELMSNVAIANIILPVVVEMSVGMRINPIYFMVPITVFCSFAFHLPVGTPPNAIVSEGGNVKTVDMMIGGLGPTVATFITFLPMWLLYGAHIYEATGFPSWAEKTNGTRLE